MILTDFTYNGITFSKFSRGSGIQADVVSNDHITIRSTRDPLPAQPGIQRYIDEYGSRLLEIRGWVKGSSESDLAQKCEELKTAFDIKELEAAGNYGFSALQWTDPGQGAAIYYMKPLNKTLVITEENRGLSMRFSVLLEAKDPTKYQSTSTSYTITVNGVGSGGSGFPFGFPVPFSGSVGSGSGTVVNSGSTSVFPQTITLYGPASGTWTAPKITNSTSGEYIEFTSSVTLTSGQYVVIDERVGTAQKYNGSSFEDVAQYITSESTFWQLGSGSSTIQIDGSSTPTGSYAIIVVISSFS